MTGFFGKLVIVAALATAVGASARQAGTQSDVVVHKVKKHVLNATYREKGRLESSANTELICRVRNRQNGYATNILRVVNDGALIDPGDELMLLDDSALNEDRKDQEIVVAKRKADLDKLEESRRGKEQTEASKARLTAVRAVYNKESAKLVDVIAQQSSCHIVAPRNIKPGSMVVYIKTEGNRFGAQTTIEQGAMVKEGQKLLRIPNLEQMQVNTKIHESVVTHVRGDRLVPTHIAEFFQVGMYANTNPFMRAFVSREEMLELIEEYSVNVVEFQVNPEKCKKYGVTVEDVNNIITSAILEEALKQVQEQKKREGGARDLPSTIEGEKLFDIGGKKTIRELKFRVAAQGQGQPAVVQIDVMPDKRFRGRVKSVSQVPNQGDLMMSDVKLYLTVVTIEGEIGPDGKVSPLTGAILKPGMTGEVTIELGPSKEPVLTIPLRAAIGTVKAGEKCDVFVKTKSGYERHTVVLGLFNDYAVEVKEGLTEGDEVVTNPQALAKKRD